MTVNSQNARNHKSPSKFRSPYFKIVHSATFLPSQNLRLPLRYHRSMKRIAIIGGGAAGLAAAVSAARSAEQYAGQRAEEVDVVVFEAADRVGKSILATGNGRCNFSNKDMVGDRYHGHTFVGQTYRAIPPYQVFELFGKIGLLFSEDSEGRLYPFTNKASTVLDVLRFALEDFSVNVVCNRNVHTVTPVEDSYLLAFDNDETAFFDAVIVACGGSVARHLLPPSYSYIPPKPMLGPLKTDTECLHGLNNTRVKCSVSVNREGRTITEEGEVLFREYGVSGIAVFNLSRYVRPGETLHLDFFSSYSKDQLERILRDRFVYVGHRDTVKFCAGILQPAVARAALKKTRLPVDAPLTVGDIPALVQTLKDFSLTVQSIGDARQCQIKRGGFKTDGFDPQTMQSKSDPGLFVAGEALDVDGPCGGYNLHWAWASGILAGRATITFLTEKMSR